MDYDLIVVGGGPGGLMAARTAAGAGMKVLLVERKKVLPEIQRACLQYFYLRWVSPDGYLEPTSVQLFPDNTARFHLHGAGCSVDYRGPVKPVTNAFWLSPAGIEVVTRYLVTGPSLQAGLRWLVFHNTWKLLSSAKFFSALLAGPDSFIW